MHVATTLHGERRSGGDRRDALSPYEGLACAAVLLLSTWTAWLQLMQPWSVAFRAAGDSGLADALSLVQLVLAALGWLYLLAHALHLRVWRALRSSTRHKAGMFLFAALGGIFGMRAFTATDAPDLSAPIAGYYLAVAALAIGVARAIKRDRHGAAR